MCSWLGRDISSASNMVFANGLLDPWSGGGVLEVCSLPQRTTSLCSTTSFSLLTQITARCRPFGLVAANVQPHSYNARCMCDLYLTLQYKP